MKKIIIIVVAVVVVIAAVAVFLLMPKPLVREYYSPGESFVTNVLESECLVKITFTLVISQEVAEDLTAENAKIRDCILNILRNQTEETYRAGNMQEVLSGQIISQLNALFPKEDPADPEEEPLFIDVYFNDFVLQ